MEIVKDGLASPGFTGMLENSYRSSLISLIAPLYSR